MGISNIASNLRPGICTSTTRPTTPYEGQVIYETDTNRTLVWDNAAWVDPSTGKTGRSGLVFIKEQTVGTTVSSVTVSDVFSADFQNYKIIYTGGVGSTGSDWRLRMGATSTGYYFAGNWTAYSGSVDKWDGSNQAYWTTVGHGSASGGVLICDLLQPFESVRTSFHGVRASIATDSVAGAIAGFLNNTTSYTSFEISPASGTITGGIIRVYGYNQ